MVVGALKSLMISKSNLDLCLYIVKNESPLFKSNLPNLNEQNLGPPQLLPNMSSINN